MILARVPVPVVFEDITLILYILGGIILVPGLFALLVAIVTNRKAEKDTRSLFKPFISGIGGGVLIALIVSSLAYAAMPYLTSKQAFTDVSNYYETNITTEDSTMPVKLFETSPLPEPKKVNVYRVPGGNPRACTIGYTVDEDYVLYCDGNEFRG